VKAESHVFERDDHCLKQDNSLSSNLFDFSRGDRDWHSRTPRTYAVRIRK
jgi:hypothetical protein